MLLGWSPSLVGWRPLLVGWRALIASRLEPIASRLETIASSGPRPTGCARSVQADEANALIARL